ncbi:hypothetical protein Pint_00784 [Pistacia integerrima]|uniref:Uncharacterized protein n=1 Tax=Pistacia integerrima TaxID=434235 RepID=A0ACC0ZKX4_9ROSI|nr:hypothetical protein Pint_00784 [Pistacia integerrima]
MLLLRMLDRILGLLVSYRVLGFGCSFHGGEKLHNVAPVGKYFMANQDGVSLYPLMALVLDKVCLQSWFHGKDAILEGGMAFNKGEGRNIFEYSYSEPSGFEQFKQLVDVGRGLGVTLNIITSKYPPIKGVNFDFPHVIQLQDAPFYPVGQ